MVGDFSSDEFSMEFRSVMPIDFPALEKIERKERSG